MGRGGREEDINPSAGGGTSGIPFLEGFLLQRDLLLVELPVLVDGDGFAAVEKRLDVRYARLSGDADIAADVFTSVDCVVEIHESDVLEVVGCIPDDDLVAAAFQLVG